MSSHRKKQRQRRIRRRHRQRRHQRLREVHRQSIHAHLIFLLFLALMELCIGGVWSLFGGPRGELCHTRKELEKDIFPAYGIPICTENWDPYVYATKLGCERCLSIASERERELYFQNGRHQRISRTSGGCTRACERYKGLRFYGEDVPPVLCRICFNATHMKVRRKDDTSRRLSRDYVKA